MEILDGKKVSEEIIINIKNKIKTNNLNLTLAIIWVGNDSSSEIYVNNKIKKCENAGIKVELHHLDDNIKENELLLLIDELNKRSDVDGILLQSPIPNHINIINCFNRIDYKKDIDGFSNVSIGNLILGSQYNIPCTPKGIIKLLDYYNIDVSSKNVCIINRSNIVGKPLFNLLINRDATVTMCHSKTNNLAFYTKNADIVITAVGKVNFLTGDMIKDGAIVIDVGITRVDGKVKGDVEVESVSKKASYLTPVPKGVGPMTIAMVLDNMVERVK